VSEQYEIPLGRLVEFNELKNQDVVEKDQLLYLQRKRKTGATEFHIVQAGECLYDICQAEGIRYESALELNLLNKGEEPAAGEKIYLQSTARSKPALVGTKSNESNQLIDPSVNLDAKTAGGAATPPPTAVTHVVQMKETLYSIAKKYGVEVESIQKWNKLGTADLKTGQELIIYKN
ncbi:MAG TPA: LysM peptidoglycan-binding domain-containing protein, partial [Puia sp.]|nr:LysM peptidoglycan-binding domain-containing protein [Puia sp.]